MHFVKVAEEFLTITPEGAIMHAKLSCSVRQLQDRFSKQPLAVSLDSGGYD